MLESARELKTEKPVTRKSTVLECFLYQDGKLLGWDCFAQQSVSIGKHEKADIVLDDDAIADVQAVFYLTGDEITVFDISVNEGVTVNEELVSTRKLGPLDFVKIGSYAIKVKIQKPSSLSAALTASDNHLSRNIALEESESVAEVVISEYGSDIHDGPAEEYTGSSSLYQSVSPSEEANILDRDRLTENEIIPFVADKDPAEFVEEESETEILERDKAQSDILSEPIQDEKPVPMNGSTVPESHNTVSEEYLHEIETQYQHIKSGSFDYEDETEEDEEDDEGDLPLFLRDTLVETRHLNSGSVNGRTALQIIKFRDEHVYDICFLDEKEKYHSTNGKRKFCLAENKNSKGCYFYFTDRFRGQLCTGDEPDTDITDLCTHENVHSRRQEIYHSAVPEKGTVVITDEHYSYLIRKVLRSRSPRVADTPQQEKRFHKSLLHSAGFHIVLMILVALFVSMPEKQRPEPESRFVHIDTTKLNKPEPVKPQKKKLKKEKPTVKKAKKLKKAATKKTAKKTMKKTAAQKGNVKKRNIKQAGILGLIGTSTGIKPKEALASVTNLDTVTSPRMREDNFRISGIADKLDSPEIELPVGDMLKTRGSSQVLRSAGTKGEGRIAELNEGTAGHKGVKGMVSVELDNTVRVQGGMSREAVKRVIDQHMDEVSYCYENALMGNPSLAGSIVFEWKILLSGKVGEVGIKTSSVKSDSIHSCIKSAIKSWQFPKPKHNEVIVSYPFVFDIVGF